MIGDDDLDVIFNSGDFDEEAIFDLGADTLTVRGIFTDASDSVVMFGQVQIEAAKPSLMCKTDDIADVRNKMTVTVRSTQYTVEKVEKVGVGISVVYLKT